MVGVIPYLEVARDCEQLRALLNFLIACRLPPHKQLVFAFGVQYVDARLVQRGYEPIGVLVQARNARWQISQQPALRMT